MTSRAVAVLGGSAEGPVLALPEALSFWGGVDPVTGCVIDVHHPAHERSLAGTVLMMPTSRGSCTGSGVLLDLALSGKAPAALVFREPEDVLTLGALVAAELFERTIPVFRLSADALDGGARCEAVQVIVTAGRRVIADAREDGTLARLKASHVAVLPDLCWCSISRPVFPERARTVLTNSGKYAHYGPGLSGCAVRLGTLADCVEAALSGEAAPRRPPGSRDVRFGHAQREDASCDLGACRG